MIESETRSQERTAITVREAAEDCEVTRTSDVWNGPIVEYDKYGNPTGSKFYRCRDCGREILEGFDKSNVSHQDGCRFD